MKSGMILSDGVRDDDDNWGLVCHVCPLLLFTVAVLNCTILSVMLSARLRRRPLRETEVAAASVVVPAKASAISSVGPTPKEVGEEGVLEDLTLSEVPSWTDGMAGEWVTLERLGVHLHFAGSPRARFAVFRQKGLTDSSSLDSLSLISSDGCTV